MDWRSFRSTRNCELLVHLHHCLIANVRFINVLNNNEKNTTCSLPQVGLACKIHHDIFSSMPTPLFRQTGSSEGRTKIFPARISYSVNISSLENISISISFVQKLIWQWIASRSSCTYFSVLSLVLSSNLSLSFIVAASCRLFAQIKIGLFVKLSQRRTLQVNFDWVGLYISQGAVAKHLGCDRIIVKLLHSIAVQVGLYWKIQYLMQLWQKLRSLLYVVTIYIIIETIIKVSNSGVVAGGGASGQLPLPLNFGLSEKIVFLSENFRPKVQYIWGWKPPFGGGHLRRKLKFLACIISSVGNLQPPVVKLQLPARILPLEFTFLTHEAADAKRLAEMATQRIRCKLQVFQLTTIQQESTSHY